MIENYIQIERDIATSTAFISKRGVIESEVEGIALSVTPTKKGCKIETTGGPVYWPDWCLTMDAQRIVELREMARIENEELDRTMPIKIKRMPVEQAA